MIRPVSLSRVKVRPTDRKIKKSVNGAQHVALKLKNNASIDTKQMATKLYEGVSFIKNAVCHKSV